VEGLIASTEFQQHMRQHLAASPRGQMSVSQVCEHHEEEALLCGATLLTPAPWLLHYRPCGRREISGACGGRGWALSYIVTTSAVIYRYCHWWVHRR
jgi:hypothetical protein